MIFLACTIYGGGLRLGNTTTKKEELRHMNQKKERIDSK